MQELEIIRSKIYEMRGQKVMLDRDLASMYGNSERFPEDFMFQLTATEWEILKSQFVTSRWGGTRPPYAFTELGNPFLPRIDQCLCEVNSYRLTLTQRKSNVCFFTSVYFPFIFILYLCTIIETQTNKVLIDYGKQKHCFHCGLRQGEDTELAGYGKGI